MNILAIDPGTTTGLAWRVFDGATYSFGAVTQNAELVLGFIHDFHREKSFDRIVIERFATAGLMSKYGLQTVDLVGQVKGYCYAKGIPVYLQSPQSRKAWEDKADRVLPRRLIIHEHDAMAHLLEHMELNKIDYQRA